ncbi:hypothetical protein EXU57_04440 [Segetibacter sp. 3557_3]|nr:hypothetical protein EXU57_04440 [Segetibacter sp. 3557_3]
MFKVLPAERTGLNFVNKLTPHAEFNMFNYMYYYNGAGVGAGDFNNDGLIDLFFASNQSADKLYLNNGNLVFRDETIKAKIPADSGWSTGVSVVDINNDGLLDIYVCRVGNYESLRSKNQLLVCQGISADHIPWYKDEANRYGLDFSGFSTQSVFLDYDMDGDLDMFLLNHSVHQNGSFAERKNFMGTYSPLSGDRLYRNEYTSSLKAGKLHAASFTDVTKQSGINSTAISYGLGAVASDIDLDGYPDMYVGNDFHENDYLYINQHDGTFNDESSNRLMHTSQYSMGVDAADINNDGHPEIISMDMLPSDPYILKRSLGEDDYNIFNLKLSFGYQYQYTRNNLQLNRGNGMFSEVGLYAGVYATDWSWAPLFMDFDNDGYKDLFISNGIPKRLNDIDYINYLSNVEVQEKIRSNRLQEKDMSLINKFPQIKIPNKFYRNVQHASFRDVGVEVEGNVGTYSNGSIYADLDNDGDLDIVVNNIDEPAMVYENKTAVNPANDYLEIKLKGPPTNLNAIGAKVLVYAGGGVRTYEKYPVHGFQSSMEIPLFIGLSGTRVDSMLLIWPDNTYQPITTSTEGKRVAMSFKPGLPVFDYARVKNSHIVAPVIATDITTATGIDYLHTENAFNEFDREPLIPHMISREGPALAVADINHDGLDDVFIGAAKTYKSAVFLQDSKSRFKKIIQPELEQDSMFEFTDAIWVDVNKDTHPDLVLACGGNEYFGQEDQRSPSVFINDGQGKLSKLPNAFPGIFLTASCVTANDFNNDGSPDLFVGGRSVPWNYGEKPYSYLLQNDGTGHFIDVTQQLAPGLANPGFVTSAQWIDIDKDKRADLLLSLEWGGIIAYLDKGGKFIPATITDLSGWWNFVLPVDIDKDGDTDFVAGNLGLNSRLHAGKETPVQLYFNDFDDNGKNDQLLTYYLDGREIPFAGKDELQKQMPFLKKRFLYAEDFAKTSLTDIFSSTKLAQAKRLTANYFANAILINDGKLNFNIQPLPWQAQLSTYRDAAVIDANGDAYPDILLGGNFYGNTAQTGRYDADFGSVLVNDGTGQFRHSNLPGLAIKGEIRKIRALNIGKKSAYVLARNNDSTMVISITR